MTDRAAVRRSPRLTGPAGFAVAALALLVACSSATATPSAAAPATSSPVAIASPSPGAASPSPASASPSSAAASPSSSTSPGRYGSGDPTPTPKSTPAPTAKPTPKPASLVVKSRSTSLGKVLVGPNGRTLYTLATDPNNGSGCSGSCATNWPPLTVATGTVITGGSGVSGKFGSFSRSGRRQVTYEGNALYYYKGDTAPGQTKGDGLGGVWYVATP